MSQQQRQIDINEIYAIIGKERVEKELAIAQYEQALLAAQGRIKQLEGEVASLQVAPVPTEG